MASFRRPSGNPRSRAARARPELKRAVVQGELELHYQPQLRLADRHIVGAEALLRWNHPERGLILPGAFIHVLERSPLAVPVGQWIVRQACGLRPRPP